MKVLSLTDSDGEDVPSAVSTTVNTSSLQRNFIPRFIRASTPIHWGSNHPDYGKENVQRAKWSDDELQYLSNIIVSLNSKDTSHRFINLFFPISFYIINVIHYIHRT